jgi:hypothetical protein
MGIQWVRSSREVKFSKWPLTSTSSFGVNSAVWLGPDSLRRGVLGSRCAPSPRRLEVSRGRWSLSLAVFCLRAVDVGRRIARADLLASLQLPAHDPLASAVRAMTWQRRCHDLVWSNGLRQGGADAFDEQQAPA